MITTDSKADAVPNAYAPLLGRIPPSNARKVHSGEAQILPIIRIHTDK